MNPCLYKYRLKFQIIILKVCRIFQLQADYETNICRDVQSSQHARSRKHLTDSSDEEKIGKVKVHAFTDIFF